MALINTLRERMGRIVVIVVAFSMFAFILTDLLQSNSMLFGGSDRTVGEIAGNKISYEAFNRKMDELSYNFVMSYQRNPSSEEASRIREQAWNALIIENIYLPEFEKLGIEVTDEEVIDMVQGNNISPVIRQFFTNPNTGEFSRDNVIQMLQNLKNAPAQQQQSWIAIEASLRPTREAEKYSNLFATTNYATSSEAKALYDAQNSNMTVDYFYVPFFSVADSLFEVSNSEMKDYLSDHADEFQTEESRSLSYVVFPIIPSSLDSAYVMEEIAELQKGLADAQNDSIYVTINSESDNPYMSITDPELVPGALMVDGEPVEVGTVSEPILAGSKYTVVKLSGIEEGDEAFVKASHILIQWEDNSIEAKAAAKEEAESIIKKIKAGEDFAQLAAQNSDDRSNSMTGGSLGWFGENGNFVEEFKDAAFGFNGTGLLPAPVETSFGYHIIRIDEPKTKTLYKIAKIEKEIFAGDETLNEIYRNADILASDSESAEDLVTNAEAQGLSAKSASKISSNDSRVGTLANARSIVSWAYNKGEVGAVSEVFDMDGSFVVAAVTAIQEKGVSKLDQVMGEVRLKVLNEKKSAYILGKLKELGDQEFEALKDAYGTGARAGSADLTLSSNSFPNVGIAGNAVGVAFSLEEGEKTAPFTTDNGVIIIAATAKSAAETQESYDAYKTMVLNSRQGRRTAIADFPYTYTPLVVSQRLADAVKELSEIEDTRYKFY
ncbi:peptidylprolyl isomerase [Marinoscillum sp. MHG1-6]|uniref:peptidylprolyl isomerase n=1 Tax=Marinoscillum sp. MHG1-6 TaxID=2959627 RepID=UPI002157EA85|nr:peptidylprolyl isomerase [Marinoscillum sp. MHG1-6]